MRTRDWLVILGVVAAPLFACSSSDSAGAAGAGGSGGGTVKDGGAAGTAGKAGSGGGGGSTGTCELTWDGVAACDTCFQTKCAAECGQCGKGSDCDAMYTCFFACPETDTACQKKCTTDHADGYAVAMSMGDCVDASCADVCDSGGGGDECQTCYSDKCATELDACFANKGCECLAGCSDAACQTACAADATATGLYKTIATCVQTNCATECK